MACFGFFLGLSSIVLPSLLADVVDQDAWPCPLLVPMLLLAWRYPLDRRAHGVLARRLASRPEFPA